LGSPVPFRLGFWRGTLAGAPRHNLAAVASFGGADHAPKFVNAISIPRSLTALSYARAASSSLS